MNGLDRRLKKLEGQGNGMEVPYVFFTIVDKAGERGWPAKAVTPGGTFLREKDEAEGAFLVRVYRANAPAGDAKTLRDEDLELLLAGHSEEIALARAHSEPVTDAMLERAMHDLDQPAAQGDAA